MYQRFLIDRDYYGIITEEALSQLIRGRHDRLGEAEEAAEESVLEYLTENYEVERELAVGKNLMPYDNRITYPAGAHFLIDGEIYQATRTINGAKAPSATPYWEETIDTDLNAQYPKFSQRFSYKPGDIVSFNGAIYKCLDYTGLDYGVVNVPGVTAWAVKPTESWQANQTCQVWDTAKYGSKFYALLKLPPSDGSNAENEGWEFAPDINPDWGLIGDYDIAYNKFELSEHEYVVKNDTVFYPVTNPNFDPPQEIYNIKRHDPRNANLKKHILRLALYELHKLISPNNVSSARITDYETSIMWLRDASRMKINPQIPRKTGDDKKPVADFYIATYARDYNPYENPWQI